MRNTWQVSCLWLAETLRSDSIVPGVWCTRTLIPKLVTRNIISNGIVTSALCCRLHHGLWSPYARPRGMVPRPQQDAQVSRVLFCYSVQFISSWHSKYTHVLDWLKILTSTSVKETLCCVIRKHLRRSLLISSSLWQQLSGSDKKSPRKGQQTKFFY